MRTYKKTIIVTAFAAMTYLSACTVRVHDDQHMRHRHHHHVGPFVREDVIVK